MPIETTIPYRRSEEETAFLLKWAEAIIGASPEEARTLLDEMDRTMPPASPQRP